MYYLPLATGAAFVGAGAVLAAEARVIDAGLPVPRTALGLLAAFAVANGASEWTDMVKEVEELSTGAAPPGVLLLDLALVVASFALLLAFALALPGPGRRRPAAVPVLAALSVSGWGAALAGWLLGNRRLPLAEAYGTIEALTRWLLGLPACVCAAVALIALARSLEPEGWFMARLVRGAGWVLLVYGAFAAVTVLPEQLDPAWPLSRRDFGQRLGVTVEVARTVCGAAIAILLSEAFVFQTSQRLRREETHLRDDFVALVTHELGNPVAALELAAARLDETRRGARAVEGRLSEDVWACALTLRRIVADLLDASRLHARELEITPGPLALRRLVERAAEVSSARDVRTPAIRVSCPAELGVRADPARLDQILRNLLSNAAKYSRPGTPVGLDAEARGDEVVIRVVNEGPPIAPREVSRIFSHRYRARSTSADAAGLGLGLYVARGLVEAHGGRIWVERDGGSTAFCFTLPRAALADAAQPVAGRDAPGSSHAAS
jgi:signal transduction histidine kinase